MPSALAETQRRLRELFTAPGGVAGTLAEEGADAHALGLVHGDAIASARERLCVYANAYFARIHDVLARDFSALAAVLGPNLFHDAVVLYLLAEPPRHFSLRNAGDRLACFLRDDPRAAPLRARCAFAGELAALEWALVEAFDAPDAALLTRAALAPLAPEAWDGLALATTPSASLLACGWPVHDARRASEAGEAIPLLAPRACWLLVWRREERVFYREADALEAELLAAVRSGERFGALCARAEGAIGAEAAAARAAALLAQWLEEQLLADAAAA